MLVDVRVILLIDSDRMDEYQCLLIELETPRVYMRMYMMVMDASTRRWTLTLPEFDEPFGSRFHFEKFFGDPSLVYVRVILLIEAEKNG